MVITTGLIGVVQVGLDNQTHRHCGGFILPRRALPATPSQCEGELSIWNMIPENKIPFVSRRGGREADGVVVARVKEESKNIFTFSDYPVGRCPPPLHNVKGN